MPEGSENSAEEAERLCEPMMRDDTKEARPSKHSKTDAQMNSQRLWQHAQGLPGSAPDVVPVIREEVDASPPSLTQQLSLTDNHL